MLYKILIALAVIAIIAGGVRWVSDGAHIFTKDREKVVTTTHDPLFGTDVETVVWKENFQYGLLPDHAHVSHAHRSYSLVLGVSIAVVLGSLFMLRRKKKATA